MRVYDVSNPAAPNQISQITNGPFPGSSEVAVGGNVAYIGKSTDGVYLYNLADPAQPIYAAHISSGFVRIAPEASGRYVFLASYNLGLWMYDVQNSGTPALAAQVSGVSPIRSVVSVGNYLYTAGSGLRIYLVVPQLRITRAETNAATISWPVPVAPGFILEQNSGLAAGWSDATNIPVVVSNRNQVILPATGTAQFFRLRHW
jgi:hypothetical protein